MRSQSSVMRVCVLHLGIIFFVFVRLSVREFCFRLCHIGAAVDVHPLSAKRKKIRHNE